MRVLRNESSWGMGQQIATITPDLASAAAVVLVLVLVLVINFVVFARTCPFSYFPERLLLLIFFFTVWLLITRQRQINHSRAVGQCLTVLNTACSCFFHLLFQRRSALFQRTLLCFFLTAASRTHRQRLLSVSVSASASLRLHRLEAANSSHPHRFPSPFLLRFLPSSSSSTLT